MRDVVAATVFRPHPGRVAPDLAVMLADGGEAVFADMHQVGRRHVVMVQADHSCIR
jgi:hypothetical protein